MQIVIDIDDKVYGLLKYFENGLGLNDKKDDNDDVKTALMRAVLNGTPLPKGHGRLIDADVFEKRLMDARSYYIGEKADDFDLRFAAGLKSAAERLVDAPTIIEADKAGDEE